MGRAALGKRSLAQYWLELLTRGSMVKGKEVEGSCQTRVRVKEEIKVLKERIDG